MDALRATLRSRFAVQVCLFLVAFAALAALLAPWLPLADPAAMESQPYLPPGPDAWMGTDNYGRDVLARLVWGARSALLVALVSSAAASLLGVIFGSISGYYGGWVDAALSRTFEVFLLIPSFFLVLLIVALFGSRLEFTMIAIALTTWPRSARIMRAQALGLKSRTYVQAARARPAPPTSTPCCAM